MLKASVDTGREIFGASTTIAHLALYSFNGCDSNSLHVYDAQAILEREWRDELADMELENLTGVRARFKDGSALNVSTWADCCNDGDGYCKHCGQDRS